RRNRRRAPRSILDQLFAATFRRRPGLRLSQDLRRPHRRKIPRQKDLLAPRLLPSSACELSWANFRVFALSSVLPQIAMPPDLNIELRLATPADIPALHQLIETSVRVLQRPDYTPEQIEGALERVLGLDTQLITDGTYFIAEARAACARHLAG